MDMFTSHIAKQVDNPEHKSSRCNPTEQLYVVRLTRLTLPKSTPKTLHKPCRSSCKLVPDSGQQNPKMINYILVK